MADRALEQPGLVLPALPFPALPLGEGTAGTLVPGAVVATASAPRALPRLVVHELGSTPSLPAIGEAVALIQRHGPRASFALVVPTRSALEHAKNEVVRLAGSADPRAFYTVLGLAKRVLGMQAPRLATPRARDLLLERALRQAELDDLRGAARFRGFRRALLHLFGELDAAGVEGPALARTLAAGTRRRSPGEGDHARDHARVVHARIIEGYRAYRAALRREHLALEGELLEKAARAIDDGRSSFPLPDLVLVDGFVDLTPRQLQLVTALARRAPETSVHWIARSPNAPAAAPAEAPPTPDAGGLGLEGEAGTFATLERGTRALVARGFVPLGGAAVESRAAPAVPATQAPSSRAPSSRAPSSRETGARAPAVDHVLGSLFRAGAARRESADDAVSFVRAASPEDEASVALRIARGVVLDGVRGRAAPGNWRSVLVIVPDARAARAPFERAARELEVPLRVHAPRPLAAHPAVQGALAFVRVAVTLESSHLLVAAGVAAIGLDVRAAERLASEVRRRGIPAGREALAALVGDRAESSPLPPAARALVRDALSLARRLDAAPVASDATDGTRVVDAALALAQIRELLVARLDRPTLRDLAPALPVSRPQALDDLPAVADETAALDALEALLRELEGLLQGERLPARALVARLEEEVREADYAPRDRRRDVVHVVDLAEARSWSAPVVVVAGLAQGTFPRPARDDLLDDGVRRSAVHRGIPLATADEHVENERLLFLLAVASAREQLHLVYPGFDASGEPHAPSAFLEAAESLFTDAALARARVRRSPSDIVGASLADVATLADARRFAYLRSAASFRPGADPARAASLVHEPELRALRGAALLDALVRAEPAALAPLSAAEPAAELEARRVRAALAVPTWSLPQGPGGRALDRVYSASELETYAACPYRHFVRHLLGARRREDLASTGVDARVQGKIVHRALERAVRLREPAGEAFDAAFAEAVRDLPLGPDEETFRRAARAAVVAFLEGDDPEFLARTGLQVSRVEVPFGPGTELGPLVVPDPVLNGAIQLEGRIDRIDCSERGAFVTDYKLGGEVLDGRARVALAKGEKLQLPVYLLAVARVLGQAPLGAALVALASRRRTGIVSRFAHDLAFEAPRVSLTTMDVESILHAAEESIRAIVRGIAAGSIEADPREPNECRRCDARDVCRFRERPAGGPQAPGRALPRATATAPVATAPVASVPAATAPVATAPVASTSGPNASGQAGTMPAESGGAAWVQTTFDARPTPGPSPGGEA